MAGAVLDGTDAGHRAQTPDDQLDARLVFDASTMMVRASDVKLPRSLCPAAEYRQAIWSPSRSRLLRRHALQRITYLELQRLEIDVDEVSEIKSAAVADRHELHAAQPAERGTWRDDDDGMVAIAGDFGRPNRRGTRPAYLRSTRLTIAEPTSA